MLVSTIPNRDLIPATSIGDGSGVSPEAKSCCLANAAVFTNPVSNSWQSRLHGQLPDNGDEN
jgi:hypothetical protein